MQASEFWDTGDVYKKDDQSGNTDKDHVPQVQAEILVWYCSYSCEC